MNTEWDVGGVTFDRNALQQENVQHAQLEERFLEFIRTYRRDNAFIYRYCHQLLLPSLSLIIWRNQKGNRWAVKAALGFFVTPT